MADGSSGTSISIFEQKHRAALVMSTEDLEAITAFLAAQPKFHANEAFDVGIGFGVGWERGYVLEREYDRMLTKEPE